METRIATSEAAQAKRPRWRLPLIIVACLTLYSGCDTMLGPGLVEGAYDQLRYTIITSQLRVGESREDAERAFRIGLTEPVSISGTFTNNKSGIEAMFLPWHMICFADERYLQVVIGKDGRVQSWDSKESGDGC